MKAQIEVSGVQAQEAPAATEVAAEIRAARWMALRESDPGIMSAKEKEMTTETRHTYSAAFTAKATLTAVQGKRTSAEVVQQFEVHLNQITEWKRQRQERATDVSGAASHAVSGPSVDMKAPHAEMGQLASEDNFFADTFGKAAPADWKEMINYTHVLPLNRQAKLLALSRLSGYYLSRSVSDTDLALMLRINELYLDHPFAAVRMPVRIPWGEGHIVVHKYMCTSIKRMSLEVLYCKPTASRKHATHEICSFLLRNRKIKRNNYVWAPDTTYIPMACGFFYPTVVIDWTNPDELWHQMVITLDAEHVVALEEVSAEFGQPEIANIDKYSYAFSECVPAKNILSLTDKENYRDNLFEERLRLSVKYEEIYLKAYESVRQARRSIAEYPTWCRHCRPQFLAGRPNARRSSLRDAARDPNGNVRSSNSRLESRKDCLNQWRQPFKASYELRAGKARCWGESSQTLSERCMRRMVAHSVLSCHVARKEQVTSARSLEVFNALRGSICGSVGDAGCRAICQRKKPRMNRHSAGPERRVSRR